MNNSHLIRLLFGISVLFTLPNLAYAVYLCVDIRKEISADGGLTWVWESQRDFKKAYQP